MKCLRMLQATYGAGRRTVPRNAFFSNLQSSRPSPILSCVTRSVRTTRKVASESGIRSLQSDTTTFPAKESVIEVFQTVIEANMCSVYMMTEIFSQVLTDCRLTDDEVKELVRIFETEYKLSHWLNVFLNLAINNDFKLLGHSLVQGIIDNPDLITEFNLRPQQAFLQYIMDESEESEFTKLVVDFVKQVDENRTFYFDDRALRKVNYRLWKAVCSNPNKEFKGLDFISPIKLQSLITSLTADKMTYVLKQIYDPDTKEEVDLDVVNTKFASLLSLMREKKLVIDQKSASVIEAWWKLLPGGGQRALRDTLEFSECRMCGSQIKKAKITDSDLKLLRNDFLENLKCDAQRMYASTPDYNLYLEFLSRYENKNKQRFDCVIDLLNIIYAKGRVAQNTRFRRFLPLLTNIVKAYNLKRILLIGKIGPRSHYDLFESATKRFRRIGVELTFYFAPGQSKDDLFILDAACWSGTDCFVVSSDNFRQHLALINNKALFEQWLTARRILTDRALEAYLPPVLVEHEIQGSVENGWHIPFTDLRFNEITPFYRQWLCLQRRQSR